MRTGVDARQLSIDFFGQAEAAPASASAPAGAVDAPDDRLDDHARRLAGYLSVALPQPVDVVFHRNRHTMISYKSAQGRLVVRLHRMFRHAESIELHALARFIAGREPAASRILDRFIDRHRAEIGGGARRRVAHRGPAGEVYDLSAVLARVRDRYFGGIGDVAIGWGAARNPGSRRRRRARTRSRALATYSFEDRTIRVSPVLDSARVPEFVLEWIVYHEMLHHVLPAEDSGGRRRFHTRRFRALERGFERYGEAQTWEKANLEWLLA
jgi:hypothetical protein